jgi:hypothetical protein
MAIISINGRAGSGKDTVGRIIQYLTSECSNSNGTKYRIFEEFIKKGGGSDARNYDHHYQSDWQIKKYSDKLKDMVCILIGCTREELESQDFKATPLGEEWWTYYWRGQYYSAKQFNEEMLPEYQVQAELIKTTPRDILQSLGTDYGRKMLHPDIWINSLFADYHSGVKMSDYTESKWIITDSRFPNDVERVKSLGGICIRVNRNPKHVFTRDGIDYVQENNDPWYYNVNFKQYKDRKHYNELIPMRSNEHESETALDNYEGFDYVIDNNGTIEELIEKVKEILIKENIINEGQ